MTKEEIQQFLSTTELDIQRANASFLFCEMIYSSYVESDTIHGILFSPVFCYFSGQSKGDFYQFSAKSMLASVAKKLYDDFLISPKSLDQKIDAHLEIEYEIKSLWDKYCLRQGKRSKDEFIRIFANCARLVKEWWRYAAIGEDKGAIIQERIVPRFASRHHLDFSEANNLFNHLSHPTKQVAVNAERADFLNICFDYYYKREIAEKINNYLEKYFWIRSNFYRAKEISEESLLVEIDTEIKGREIKEIESELEKIESTFEKIVKSSENLPGLITLSEKDETDLKFARKIIEWMDIRKVGMMKNFYYLSKMVEDFSELIGVDYDTLVSHSLDEILDFADNEEKFFEIKLSDRSNGVFMEFGKDQSRVDFFGGTAKELFETATSFEGSAMIVGQVASKGSGGKIVGKVKVVVSPASDDFGSEEILVTSMTRVEFMPLMRQAKAIITDEGGIACHAAIISRELHKPCIIGTKVATSILQNGDLVEIDTDTGTVQKIT